MGKKNEIEYKGLSGLSDDQLDQLVMHTQGGFGRRRDGQIDYSYYDGGGSQRYNENSFKSKRDPEKDTSLLFKAAFDGDYKNVNSPADIADMYMRLKDERTRRKISGMIPEQGPEADAVKDPEVLESGINPEETQAAIDRAGEYEANLPNYGTDVFGERNTNVYGYDYDWQNGIRPEGTPGRDDEASEAADEFAKNYKLNIASGMKPKDRQSAVDTPVNVKSGVSLFGQ